MGKTVLLTGGAGFIGSHTVEYFLKNTDYNIIVLDRLSYAGNLNRLTESKYWDSDRVKFYYHDFRSSFSKEKIGQLTDLFGSLEYIVHMGAESHVDRSIEDPYPFVYSNVLGTVNILELAKCLYENKLLECMVYVSTDEIYGPVKGSQLHKETDSHNPSNPYSASKASGENFCIAYHNTHNIPIMITRTMNNYGERQDIEKFVPKVVYNVLNDLPVTVHCALDSFGTVIDVSSRCWLHAQNHADGIDFLLKNGLPGESYNITGEKVYVDQLAMRIAEILGKDIDLKYEDFHSFRPGHDMHYGLDGSKMNELGWEPPVSLSESLEKTVKWISKNKNWLY